MEIAYPPFILQCVGGGGGREAWVEWGGCSRPHYETAGQQLANPHVPQSSAQSEGVNKLRGASEGPRGLALFPFTAPNSPLPVLFQSHSVVSALWDAGCIELNEMVLVAQ